MKTRDDPPTRRRGSERRGGRDAAARKADPASPHRSRPARNAGSAREVRAPRSGPQTSPIARPAERQARPTSTRQAKARSKARKAKAPKAVRPRLSERLAARLASIDLRPQTLASKVPFVVLVIGALGFGLGLTLWLSTDSAERSYKLSHAREKHRVLQLQKEALERDVREAESAPALAEAARKLGMIPTQDTAHLIQDPAGNWVVVGTPKPADGVPPPPLNSKLPEPGPPVPPKPAALPAEVPIRVEPGTGGPQAPARSGPEALLRAPDGSSTVGGQHIPQAPLQAPMVPLAPLAPPAPIAPLAPIPPYAPSGPLAGLAPGGIPRPGLPTPIGPAPAPGPAEVRMPLGGSPPAPALQDPGPPAPVPVAAPQPSTPGAPQ